MAGDTGEANGGEYNATFERLVDQSDLEIDDIRGMIAYAKYKREKRQWAQSLHSRHGRGPNAEELHQYMQTITDARIKGLTQQADESINEFASAIIAENRHDIEKQALRGVFLKDVLVAVAGSAVYTLLLIALAVVLKFAGLDLIHIYDNIGEKPAAHGATTP